MFSLRFISKLPGAAPTRSYCLDGETGGLTLGAAMALGGGGVDRLRASPVMPMVSLPCGIFLRIDDSGGLVAGGKREKKKDVIPEPPNGNTWRAAIRKATATVDFDAKN